jgi:hypothetical protein
VAMWRRSACLAAVIVEAALPVTVRADVVFDPPLVRWFAPDTVFYSANDEADGVCWVSATSAKACVLRTIRYIPKDWGPFAGLGPFELVLMDGRKVWTKQLPTEPVTPGRTPYNEQNPPTDCRRF